MTDSLFDQAREHRAGLRTAIGLVESALASPAPGRAKAWSEDLRQQLEELSVALEQHIVTTESSTGLLADIETIAPRLAHRVEVTRRDHVRLRAELTNVLVSLPADDDRIVAVRDRVVDVLTGLVRHRQAGADLVYEAYNVEIEGGD
jgi:hypothetical protein